MDLATRISKRNFVRAIRTEPAVALDEVLAVGWIGQTRDFFGRRFSQQPHHRQPAHTRAFANQQVAGQKQQRVDVAGAGHADDMKQGKPGRREGE